jgi:hypothetical protein
MIKSAGATTLRDAAWEIPGRLSGPGFSPQSAHLA